MVISHLRGHRIYWDELCESWFYMDDDKAADQDRPCPRCGRMPTKEGYDACLGYIPGVVSACCGHGVCEPFILYQDDGINQET